MVEELLNSMIDSISEECEKPHVGEMYEVEKSPTDNFVEEDTSTNQMPEYYYHAPRLPDRRKKERRTFEVSEMREIHHEIVRLHVIGMSNRQIAKMLNCSEPMVSYTLNSKIVQDKIDLMRSSRDADTIDLTKVIRNKAPKSLALLEDIIDDAGENFPISLAARTAENWLNRAGYAPVQKVMGAVAHLTADEIENLKKEALNSAKVSNIIEGEVVEDAKPNG